MSRQVALERELEQLKRINGIVGDMITSINVTHKNLGKSNESMENTNKLVDQWIRILSQTDYTKEILLNSNWKGEEDIDHKINEKLAKEKELNEIVEKLTRENQELAKKLDEDRTDVKKRRRYA